MAGVPGLFSKHEQVRCMPPREPMISRKCIPPDRNNCFHARSVVKAQKPTQFKARAVCTQSLLLTENSLSLSSYNFLETKPSNTWQLVFQTELNIQLYMRSSFLHQKATQTATAFNHLGRTLGPTHRHRNCLECS